MQCCEKAPGKPCYMTQGFTGWECLVCGKPPKEAKVVFEGSKVKVFDAKTNATVVLVNPSTNLDKMKTDVVKAARSKGYKVRTDKFRRLVFEGAKIT